MHSSLYERTTAGAPNFARYTFLDDDSHGFYPDWDGAADICVAILRTEAGRAPHDRQLPDLVGELATLPRKLEVSGMPKGDRAAAGEIGYYSPNGGLVLYYEDVGYWEGIVRLGRLDTPVALIAGLPDGLRGVVERSD